MPDEIELFVVQQLDVEAGILGGIIGEREIDRA